MIKIADERDISEIDSLGKHLKEDFSLLFDIEKELKEEHTKIYIMYDDDKGVAFLHVTELYENIDIVNIVVDPKLRKKGYATLLMDYMLSELSEKIEIITLEVAVDNINAIKLYSNFGFEIINKRLGYYAGKDAYLMGKKTK